MADRRPARWLALILAVVLWAGPAQAQREHIVHFQGTPYQLDVFRIYGHKPGPTLMLIGGIQGNEPGGFLSADSYADLTLERGNLIVVPRANFYSIMLNSRGPNGDMNRKFASSGKRDREIRIVEILKTLMGESDCLLNLHDGSGFYREKWINDRMNPRRYGQSVIADAEVYSKGKGGRSLPLGRLARQVCDDINQAIDNPKYHFRFSNHRTLETTTTHKEQRGSATYYALTQVGIPAFGIETSKELPSIEMKVRHHNLAINAFMKRLGIVPENPVIKLEDPKLRYVVMSINGRRPTVVANKETLTLERGDRIFISHIEANYERGLSCDILGLGGVNDTRASFAINRPTSLVVRKDHLQCGWIRLKVKPAAGGKTRPTEKRSAEADEVVQYFVISVNGEERLVGSGMTLNLIGGDTLKLKDAWTASGLKGQFALNFKGFVPRGGANTGDDRGLAIRTDKGLMAKWSLGGQGERYRVVAERGESDHGEFYISINDPQLNYVIVKTGGADKLALAPGETLLVDESERVELVDLKANFDVSRGVRCDIRFQGRILPLKPGQAVRLKGLRSAPPGQRTEMVIHRFQTRVGSILLAPRPISAGRQTLEPAG